MVSYVLYDIHMYAYCYRVHMNLKLVPNQSFFVEKLFIVNNR